MDEDRARTRPVTGTEVARAAGVSQSVVSLVFSGRAGSRVSAVTERRVLDVARRLGYVPNRSASALKTGRSDTLALAVPVIGQPFFSAVLQAAEARARALGYSMVLLSSGSDAGWPQHLIDMLRGNQLAGAIVYGPTSEAARSLAETRLPVVACELNGPMLPTVDVDLSVGVTAAADLLLTQGHRSIGYLGTAYPHVTYELRYEAFVARLRNEGMRLAALERSEPADFDAAVAAATALLGASEPVTAVMCDDDLLAPAVIRAAHARGLSVPADLSVIGVGDLSLARMLTPSLTTVSISAADIGAGAVDDLLAVLDGQAPRRRVVATDLIVRESVAAARR